MSIKSGPHPNADPHIAEVAGQVLAVRSHRGTQFLDVGIPGDPTQQIAVTNETTQAGANGGFNPNIGDIVQATGKLAETATSIRRGLGQITLFAATAGVMSRNQQPRWPGANVAEQHERQADYISVLRERHNMRKGMRAVLDGLDYVEVETSMLQRAASGAAARTFQTNTEFDGNTRYLRIAPEVDLKIVAAQSGLPKVFEIGRSFRNEGVSPVHHPEFTSLETYTAYDTESDTLALAEVLLKEAARAVGEDEHIFDNMPVVEYADLMGKLGIDVPRLTTMTSEDQLIYLRRYMARHNILTAEAAHKGPVGLLDMIFKGAIRPHINDPVVIRGYLAEQMPLAATRRDDPGRADCFQIVFRGNEIVKAYQELVDPDQLEKNLAAQGGEDAEDAVVTDRRLIDAALMGLPPMWGMGIGLDRLQALLTGRRIDRVIPVPINAAVQLD